MIKNLLFYLVMMLFVLSVSAIGGGMYTRSQEEIRELLINFDKDDFYLNLLRQADNYYFEKINLKSIKHYSLYLCILADPGMEEHNFNIAISADDTPLVLSGSIENIDIVFHKEGVYPKTIEEAKDIILDYMLLYRDYYKDFEIIASVSDLINDVDDGTIKSLPIRPIQVKMDNGYFEAKLFLKLGRDIVERNVVLKKFHIRIEDKIIAKDAMGVTSPHQQ